MRRAALLMGVLLALPVLAGMGVFGGNQSPKVPTTLKDRVSAQFEDSKGTRLRIDKVNIGGDEHVRGRLGEGLVLIPFSRLKSLSFGEPNDRMRKAQAELTDGRTVSLEIKSDTEFSGASEFGAYYVQVRNLRAIRFDRPEGAEAAEGPEDAVKPAPEGDAPKVPGL